MTLLSRIPVVLALAAALLLALAGAARADPAYDKVASAYAQAGGQLDPCAFTQAELEAAIRGIPPQIRDVVPDLRRAMEDGVAAHGRGDCAGRAPADQDAGGAGAPVAPATPTTPTVPSGTTPAAGDVATTPAPVDPTTAPAPAPADTTAADATTAPAQAPAADDDDLTPLLVALVAVGALLLLALLLWAWARMRGWDPPWVARLRHAWGEAGFRTTTTWAEFTDWLRLGR